MPNITIDLPQKAIDKLQPEVDRTNNTQGTDYTLAQWIELNIKERAITNDLAITIPIIQQQHEAGAQAALDAAVRAERDRLLQEL